MNKHGEIGQGFIEYALLLIFIALVVLIALQFIGPTIGNFFNDISSTLESL